MCANANTLENGYSGQEHYNVESGKVSSESVITPVH